MEQKPVDPETLTTPPAQPDTADLPALDRMLLLSNGLLSRLAAIRDEVAAEAALAEAAAAAVAPRDRA